MRRYANFAFGAAGVLLILTTWLAPSAIGWYSKPAVPVPVSCNDAVTWGVNTLRQWQGFSLLGGAVAGCVLAFLTRKKTMQASLPAAAAPAASPAAAQVSSDKKTS